MDGGTLYQLKNLINRRNVVSDPKKDMNACEDFFLLIVEAHIVTAAMTEFKMSSCSEDPCTEYFDESSASFKYQERNEILLRAIEKVLDKFVDFGYGTLSSKSEEKLDLDGIQSYASDILSLGLLYMEFCDGIHEGDGVRIIRCWRFFLLIFKASDRRNYAIEAFILLAQEKFLLSPRMTTQLKYNRTVNIHGRKGKNIPCDLHMEHLNRECKESLLSLGSNLTDNAIQRVGKSLSKTLKFLHSFDLENNIPLSSGKHTKRSVSEDMTKLIKQLHHSSRVFINKGLSHKTFPSFTTNIMNKVDLDKLKVWMKEQRKKLLLYSM